MGIYLLAAWDMIERLLWRFMIEGDHLPNLEAGR